MSLRPPSSYLDNASGKTPVNVFEYELMAERAESLGRAGLKAEAALAALREATEETREVLTDKAAVHVYAMFIQREICGLKNGRDVITRYGIPGSVIARLGIVRRTPSASDEGFPEPGA